MESQLQQPTDDTFNSLEVGVALEPTVRGQISPATQSIAKGRWIVTQIFSFVAGLPDYVGSLFDHARRKCGTDKLREIEFLV